MKVFSAPVAAPPNPQLPQIEDGIVDATANQIEDGIVDAAIPVAPQTDIERMKRIAIELLDPDLTVRLAATIAVRQQLSCISF
jgi:hypothetical protein